MECQFSCSNSINRYQAAGSYLGHCPKLEEGQQISARVCECLQALTTQPRGEADAVGLPVPSSVPRLPAPLPPLATPGAYVSRAGPTTKGGPHRVASMKELHATGTTPPAHEHMAQQHPCAVMKQQLIGRQHPSQPQFHVNPPLQEGMHDAGGTQSQRIVSHGQHALQPRGYPYSASQLLPPAQPASHQQHPAGGSSAVDQRVRSSQDDVALIPTWDPKHLTKLLVRLSGSGLSHSEADLVDSVRLEVGGVLLSPVCTGNWTVSYDHRRQALVVTLPSRVSKEWLQQPNSQPAEFLPASIVQEHQGQGSTLLLRVCWRINSSGETVSTDS
jgi:hypothetical protein